MRIEVTPITAVINKDTDLIGKMDPYVEVTVNGVSQRTNVVKSGGRNPSWNQTLYFNAQPNDNIIFRIYDKDTLTRDDFIGEVCVPMNEVVYNRGELNKSYPIMSAKNGGYLTALIRVSGGNYGNYGGYPMYAQPMSAYQSTMQSVAAPLAQAIPMTQSVIMQQPTMQSTYVQAAPMQTSYVQAPVRTSYMPTQTSYMPAQTSYVQAPAVQTTYIQAPPVQTTQTTYVQQPVQTTYVEQIPQTVTQEVSYASQPVYTTETSYAYTVSHPNGNQPAVLSGYPYSSHISTVQTPYQQSYYRQ